MLDIKIIREDKDNVIRSLSLRGKDYTKEIEEILAIDEKRRELSSKADEKKAFRNIKSKEIPNLKKQGVNMDFIMEDMKKISDEIKEIDIQTNELKQKQKEKILSIPNLLNITVPEGKSENDNVEIRKRGHIKNFDFLPQSHWDIGKRLDIIDFERAVKISGSRFSVYKGMGAKLERALINFFLDTHSTNGYTEIMAPYIVNNESMTGTGQLPKFKEDVFKIEGLPYYLIPTAEVSVTNLYSGETLEVYQLPIKHCSFSACFRAEAGSAGRDTKGLIRQHQFNKVELVKFTTQEESYNELEKLTKDVETLLMNLKLPYRVVALCGADVGFSSAKTYDIEVWMPSYNKYVEISSCSNFEDFQSRRTNIKYRESKDKKSKYVHTLNASGLAVGRTLAAILENYQNADGTITVPDVLVQYLGTKIIK